ncbi:hypothetical protein [Helicobacter anatolicus]|uniref:hypothetical protein n=1 Tax=Helicobacter anatolicus TaxID=2905874 RepID=UPI001E3BF8B4|nr:hypothetical protein [Helicobacter anatolicus]MCE3037861.1 hypothetical protein [Helicobacter anatolicus]
MKDLKIWFFPSMCFLLFLYGMTFLFIYTYSDNFGRELFEEKKVNSKIDGEVIKNELKKIAK